MLYNELFPTANSGLFTAIFSATFVDEYNTIFGDILPSTVDTYAYIQYGNRPLTNKITTDNYSDYLSACIALAVDGMVKQAQAWKTQYDLLNPVTDTDTTTETETTTATGENTDTSAKQTFNDTEFTDNERNTGNQQETREATKSTQHIHASGGNADGIVRRVHEEIEMRKHFLMPSIVAQVIDLISISIY